MKSNIPDHAHVICPPPALFGGALLLGLLLDWLLGWHLPMPLFARSLLALIIVAIGAVPLVSALLALRAANTPVLPWLPAQHMVTTGPYRYTRNPIYIGLCLLYLGLVFLLGSGFGLLFVLPVLLVLHFGVVLREEAYLARRFGEAYASYCATTPRWLQ